MTSTADTAAASAVAHQPVAMVTGAGRGIGAATAERLASEGMAVIVVDRAEEDTTATVSAIRAAGGRASGRGCDVAEAHAVTATVASVIEEFGHLDVLVNSAGVNEDRLLLTMGDREWDTVLDVNLGGTMRCSFAVGRHMRWQGHGRIINFSSVAARGNAGQTNYATAKGAIAGFTRTLAAELGPHGVTVNAIAPGFVATPMVDELTERLGVDRETFLQEAAMSSAVGRIGTPEEVAATVAFLTHPESGYLTGETIHVEGGRR
ncbi:SDR family oxidoreductase [Nocardiopsis gilva YIM 90087]|uniref:SDR family oxidoreductase n=1 Tax=Nocardiopsis gilva YIM 90087 TaxID=1235441 RepID=A0A223S0W8_9ACTN|nr:3-oxoacyl-ACP reductase FabG [Nocardiopsis gilva]ASU81754.1 SDR family oxidoreductase [Nocardiopsis gilva YIM 90087]